ncbi:MAG: adenylate/guanylate cyclase domain-containing protein [Burkholderiales bacterium]|nr:adenylate/guanylate cyclase domain-containing protein [Burkholderiales bacterium]
MPPSFRNWLGRSPLRWHAIFGVLFIAALALELLAGHIFDTTEYRLGDVFMNRHASKKVSDPDIVVVDIDNPSMVAMQKSAGLWAWPREIHADLLMALSEFSPRAIAIDLTFAERDMKKPKSDAQLSDIVNTVPNIYLAAIHLIEVDDASGVLLSELVQPFSIERSGPLTAKAALQLPMVVDRQGWRLGIVNSVKDPDGMLRRYSLYSDIQGWCLPSLPVRVVKSLGVPVPQGDNFMIRWPGAIHKHYSYGYLYEVLVEQRLGQSPERLRALDGLFRNKIIVIGSSAAAAHDHHITPNAHNRPGVDVLAIAIDNLKNENTVKILSPYWMLLFGAMLIGTIAVAFARRVHPLFIGAGLLVVSVASIAIADTGIERNLMLPVATPLIFAWTWFLFGAVAAYLRERRSREKAVSLFGRFLNPVVVGRMVNQGETVESLSGRDCTITVLFSDIRGFTTLSETRTPQEVVTLLNRYFDRQVEVVFRHGGTLDKFIGDCIMAFWGAPVDDPDHAKRAVAAAMEMQDTLLQFKKELEAEGSDVGDFDVGIGVHSGHAVVGFIGAQKKLDYTAIGDTVNLASRVEGLTKGIARVLVTRETMQACEGDNTFSFKPHGAFHVKGRAAEVELYEPIPRGE